jgi:hypothetical protein
MFLDERGRDRTQRDVLGDWFPLRKLEEREDLPALFAELAFGPGDELVADALELPPHREPTPLQRRDECEPRRLMKPRLGERHGGVAG